MWRGPSPAPRYWGRKEIFVAPPLPSPLSSSREASCDLCYGVNLSWWGDCSQPRSAVSFPSGSEVLSRSPPPQSPAGGPAGGRADCVHPCISPLPGEQCCCTRSGDGTGRELESQLVSTALYSDHSSPGVSTLLTHIATPAETISGLRSSSVTSHLVNLLVVKRWLMGRLVWRRRRSHSTWVFDRK